MIRTSRGSAIVDLNRSRPWPWCLCGEIVSWRARAHNMRSSYRQTQTQTQTQSRNLNRWFCRLLCRLDACHLSNWSWTEGNDEKPGRATTMALAGEERTWCERGKRSSQSGKPRIRQCERTVLGRDWIRKGFTDVAGRVELALLA